MVGKVSASQRGEMPASWTLRREMEWDGRFELQPGVFLKKMYIIYLRWKVNRKCNEIYKNLVQELLRRQENLRIWVGRKWSHKWSELSCECKVLVWRDEATCHVSGSERAYLTPDINPRRDWANQMPGHARLSQIVADIFWDKRIIKLPLGHSPTWLSLI